MNKKPLLSITGLSIDFTTDNQTTRAIKDISFSVNRGEILALVGESGSGKSVTSLSVLKLLPQPPAVYAGGQIMFSEDGVNSIDLLNASPDMIRQVRGNKIAMIFQEPMTSLNPVMSCGKQVMEALLIHKKINKEEAKKQTIQWFEKVKLPSPAEMFDRYPHQLSGGQKQRVMIAMAMCCQPSLLICDEPTTALDVTVQKTILELIKDLQEQQNMGVIFITHDLGVVSEIADRVAIMYKGEIVEQDKAITIFKAPQHAYTKALIACRPAMHPKGERLPVVSDFLGSTEKTGLNTPKTQTSIQDEVLVDVRELTVKFPARSNLFGKATQFITTVDSASFTIHKGETLGLVGESGCGKTTLGRALLRLVEPTSGKIIYKNRDITNISKDEMKKMRKDVQLIFQDPYSSLNPRLSIGAAIAEPMKVAGMEMNDSERRKKVTGLLDRVNLSANMLGRYPHEFSGGQRQRIVIARALALEPDFLVCDESVSALDVSVQAQVLNLLNELKKDLGLTMLFISHDLSVVRYMCDRIMVMNKGAIIESGPAEDVYHRPQNHYTKTLIEAIPSL
ncbi:MAG TPA: ABC transporter ATP-binding protein [Flavisolibacter sp.]